MEPQILYRGTDEPIFLQVETDAGVPVSIDDLDDLEVRFAVGNSVLFKWNKAGSGDFTALEKINEFTYKFWLITDNDTPTGLCNLWIEVMADNLDIPDDIQNTVGTALNFVNLMQKPY